MIRNGLKYQRIDATVRSAARREWNRPERWPLLLIVLVVAAMLLPAWADYRRRERATATVKEH